MNENPFDVYQRLVPSETTPGQFDLITYQHVPDWYYERIAAMREASKSLPLGELHTYALPPELTWLQFCQRFPDLANPSGTIEGEKKRANEIMKGLRMMGEERCIATVHTF